MIKNRAFFNPVIDPMRNKHPLKTVLLDMDGVLWHGSKAVIDIKALFDAIQGLGLEPFCVTNNSTRTVSYHLGILEGFGVSLEPSRVITSAEATAEFLKDEFPLAGDLFVIGEEGIKEALVSSGFQILGDDPAQAALAVVVGLDRALTYQELELAVRFLERGALFIGTNPDLTIPTPSGPAPGAGTLIKAIEVSSGKKPYIIGKPYPALYSLALSRANSLPEETLMIGDRLDTDILGAQKMGLWTALVLSGISTREQVENWDPKPDFIADDVLQVLGLLRKDNAKFI